MKKMILGVLIMILGLISCTNKAAEAQENLELEIKQKENLLRVEQKQKERNSQIYKNN